MTTEPTPGMPHAPADVQPGASNTPDPTTDRGTGVPEPQKPAQEDDQWFSDVADAVRPVHYREAADSLSQIAEHMPDTSSAADLRPGIQYAATLLRHTATDLEDGE
jgi:hypothetical protein